MHKLYILLLFQLLTKLFSKYGILKVNLLVLLPVSSSVLSIIDVSLTHLKGCVAQKLDVDHSVGQVRCEYLLKKVV